MAANDIRRFVECCQYGMGTYLNGISIHRSEVDCFFLGYQGRYHQCLTRDEVVRFLDAIFNM